VPWRRNASTLRISKHDFQRIVLAALALVMGWLATAQAQMRDLPPAGDEGWYMTTRGGSTVLNTGVSLVALDLLPVWPQVVTCRGFL
jgi:hypothetical protein